MPISRTNIRNNWDLSALRASSVVQVLQNRFGVDPSRLSAAGRGEYRPIADNSTDSGRQRNRRTEIIIIVFYWAFAGVYQPGILNAKSDRIIATTVNRLQCNKRQISAVW